MKTIQESVHTSNASATARFCLLVRPFAAANQTTPVPSALLEIPDGLCYVATPPDGDPALMSEVPADSATSITIEQIRRASRRVLLVAAPPGSGWLLNGVAAPPLASLRDRDDLGAANGSSLVVSTWLEAQTAAPAPHRLGESCAICGLGIKPDSLILTCPWCSAVLHDESSRSASDPDRLECAATATTCPVCGNELVRGRTLSYVPEEDCDA